MNTFTPNVDGRGGKDGRSPEVCIQKELAGKAGWRKKKRASRAVKQMKGQ